MLSKTQAHKDAVKNTPVRKSDVLPNNYIGQEQLSVVLEGKLISLAVAQDYGCPLPHFFIHPDGYVYNTSLADTADLKDFLRFMQGVIFVQEQLNTSASRQQRVFFQERLCILQNRLWSRFSNIGFAAYQIEYAEYFRRSRAEITVAGHHLSVHLTPDGDFEIYRDHAIQPRLVTMGGLPTQKQLSRLRFAKQERLALQKLFDAFLAPLDVEFLNAKYNEVQDARLIAALRKIQRLENPEQTLRELELSCTETTYRDRGRTQLIKELYYMLLASLKKYAEAKTVLHDLKKTTQKEFDESVIDFYLGNYQAARQGFARFCVSPDPALRLPVLLNTVHVLCVLGLREEALSFLEKHKHDWQSPSPRAFPILYSQAAAPQEHTLIFHDLYTPAEVLGFGDTARYAEKILELLATSYTVETYYNRERGIRNFYLKLLGLDLKAAGNPEKLKAAYIAHGLFGLHQLLGGFLQTNKYLEKIYRNADMLAD